MKYRGKPDLYCVQSTDGTRYWNRAGQMVSMESGHEPALFESPDEPARLAGQEPGLVVQVWRKPLCPTP